MGPKLYIFISALFLFFIIENIFPFFNNRKFTFSVIHSLQNIALGLFNGLITVLAFGFLFKLSFNYIVSNNFGLINFLPFPIILKYIIALILIDHWTYLWHFFNHHSSLLWRFHRVHHCDLFMDGSSAIRFHSGEILMSTILRFPIYFIIGMRPEIIIIYEIALNISTIFHHSNIYLPEWLDKYIRVLFITPSMHKVHHSQIMAETNSNYGSIFSFWDRIYDTFRLSDNYKKIKLGLIEFTEKKWQNLIIMMIMPFINIKNEK